MTGPRGEECGRCYFGDADYCHHIKFSGGPAITGTWPDPWCSEFRPHPDHACKECEGVGEKDYGDGFRRCHTCHGTGLRAEEAE